MARTVEVHLFPDPRVTAKAQGQYWTQVTVSSGRGSIYDVQGVPLAISVPSVSFFVDPQFWDPRDAALLRGLFDNATLQKLSSSLKGRFHWLDRKTPPEFASRVRSLDLKGIYPLKEQTRMYPQRGILAQTLGFCDMDDRGLAGLELGLESALFSPPQVRVVARAASGKTMDILSPLAEVTAPQGGTVSLTIDSRIQHILEEVLARGAKAENARWAGAVCIDPKTGAVLGLASWPSFDPNNRQTMGNRESLRNNIIGRVYEPGSTLKPIIMGIALENGYVAPGEQFFCPSRMRFADGSVGEFNGHSYGRLNIQEIIIKSSNVGMAQIGMRFKPQYGYEALRQWGFGRTTGIELPGEETGLVYKPEQWYGVIPANIAIGQGIAMTPLQLATAICAIANGGDLLQPFLVASVTTGDGQSLYRGRRTLQAKVLSPRTTTWLRETMRRVVIEGTGKKADIPGLDVAGKTGTAQIADRGKYMEHRHVASFVGYWPYKTPRFVLLVIVGEPKNTRDEGGVIAAPLFRDMAEAIARLDPERSVHVGLPSYDETHEAPDILKEQHASTHRHTVSSGTDIFMASHKKEL